MVNTVKLCFKLKMFGIAAALLLAGCAVSPATGVNPAPGAESRKLLQPMADMTGAMPGSLFGAAVPGGYVTLRYPSAVSARNNDIYLVDSGLRSIFRYDVIQQTLAPFTSLTPDTATSVHAAPDMTVFIAHPVSQTVLHYSRNGVQLPSMNAPGNLARPISVLMDESGGRVLVADGLYDQIVVFNNLGRPLSVIKPQQLRAIAAMASGPDGVYVVDRIAHQIVVLGWDGTYRYAFGAGELSEPVAIAVSSDNLVFVGDKFDNTVKTYRVQKSQKGAAPNVVKVDGTVPGSIGGITGLAVDGRKLYVTDGPNARMQIILINP